MRHFKILTSTAMVGAILATSGGAFAQTAAAEEEGGIADIVVTARKTEESLQTTPVAVTAVGEDRLVATGLQNVTDLQQSAPGLTIARGSAGTAGIAFVAIRGQGNLQPILANDPAVATYIDGVYISRPTTAQSDLRDIQRIEVLRGPQGTLFGRNTTGGALNVITKDPTQDFGGDILGEVGNRGHRSVSFGINAPIADNLAGRIMYSFRDSDGIGTNDFLGTDVGDRKSHVVRGKLKYDSGDFSITLAGDYNDMKDHGQLTQLAVVNPDNATINSAGFVAIKAALLTGLHTKKNWFSTYAGGVVTPAAGVVGVLSQQALSYYARSKPFNELNTYGGSVTIAGKLGGVDLKAISAYRHNRDFALSDTDGSPAPVLGTYAGSNSRYYSQELQASGDITEALSFITGAYYGNEKGEEFSRSQIFGGRLRNSVADIVNKTFGLYAQGYYDITDSVRAVGGFRYTWDTRNSFLHNQQVFGLPANAPVAGTPFGINCTVAKPDVPVTATECTQTQKAKFNYPAWTAGVDWKASDNLFVYLKTSGAAKAGGWNLRAGGLPAFSPEKVKDVELGFKSDFLDRHVRLNMAAFYLVKTGNQAIVNSFVPGIGVTQYIQNNGDTRTYGVETELTVVPWQGMEISTNVSLMDGKYKKGSFNETQILSAADFANCKVKDAAVANGCVVDLSGQPLIQLPKRQINISATQTLPLTSNSSLKLFGNYAYVGSQTFLAVNIAPESSNASLIRQTLAQNALGTIKGYGVFNLRASITLDSPAIELAAFVRNVGNNKHIVRSFPDLYQSIGFAAEYAGAPRTWGLTMGYKF